MTKTIMEKVAEAKKAVPDIAPAEADAMRGRDDVLIVDVRDPTEIAASGKVAGAVNVSRGMLEFKADPASPFHDEAFQPDKTVILYCASGGRSALAGQALKELGYTKVRNLGAFKTWAEAGLPIDEDG
jgi:rhodanese-related sulfurtransferase